MAPLTLVIIHDKQGKNPKNKGNLGERHLWDVEYHLVLGKMRVIFSRMNMQSDHVEKVICYSYRQSPMSLPHHRYNTAADP